MKKCRLCKKTKQISEFRKRINYLDEYNKTCKTCTEKRRIRDQKNRETINKAARIFYYSNIERGRKIGRDWAARNPIKVKEKNREWHQKNKTIQNKKSANWRKHNRDKIKLYKNNRYKNDLIYNLNCKMSCAIKKSLNKEKNGWHWEDLVGYTKEELKKSLLKTMPNGFTWVDFLSGKLHIDHVIPKSLFNYTTPLCASFRKCWAMSNLQLMEASENIKKNKKHDKPFQLYIEI